ncbi:uncharacterized protein LACBIDRAFT_302453 [Laccaria bicolor S238N-H82]|uniref:Predicted protein n=1 Tax=Laccaria bicolor (strain S238N-H82 / ATCC MYA-4686) TaxID=486041 RepID=B0DHP0_LACBS|nr:uncharacterized protein LACBIDRAFT_302453 [Laccaria bicolor S238N-H82]EDR05761.1 predicted protein [Laccaria bicolor S238N-H82]|eukprot:XP_001883437.1 predicted protein [Laccaria bicolor S238N-H82]
MVSEFQQTSRKHLTLRTSTSSPEPLSVPGSLQDFNKVEVLDTMVGIVILFAGVGNDIIGWMLLALSVALVNAGSGLTALHPLAANLQAAASQRGTLQVSTASLNFLVAYAYDPSTDDDIEDDTHDIKESRGTSSV